MTTIETTQRASKVYRWTQDYNGSENAIYILTPDNREMLSHIFFDDEPDDQLKTDVQLIVDALNAYAKATGRAA